MDWEQGCATYDLWYGKREEGFKLQEVPGTRVSSIHTQACKLVALTSRPRPSARSSQTFCELIAPPCFISWPSLRSGSSIQFPSGHVLHFPHECDGVYPSRHLNAPHQVFFFFLRGKETWLHLLAVSSDLAKWKSGVLPSPSKSSPLPPFSVSNLCMQSLKDYLLSTHTWQSLGPMP